MNDPTLKVKSFFIELRRTKPIEFPELAIMPDGSDMDRQMIVDRDFDTIMTQVKLFLKMY
jgi:hypothetical protein